MLRRRAVLLRSIRRFFDDRGYIEVETPLLDSDVVADAYIDSMSALEADGRHAGYLQTSPESGMKRLLAAGTPSIYQICRVFRSGESGPRHNPEFTMAEWYGVGDVMEDQLALVTALLQAIASDCSAAEDHLFRKPAVVVTYRDAFLNCGQPDPLEASFTELRDAASDAAGADVGADASRDELLNIILAERVEPTLGFSGPTFLTNYPIAQAALAVASEDDPRTALRFELYANGLELANGYEELTDCSELRRREQLQQDIRREAGGPAGPGCPLLQAAMDYGLPGCSGVAAGVDRLLMVLEGAGRISEVTAFPRSRA